jgi:hypothetical protein
MNLKNNKLKSRRGLSSIVGGLLFVILMVATFAVLGVALNSQTGIVETNLQVADQELKKSQEDFSVNVFADSNEFLTVDVNNLGQNHVEIKNLVITNKTQTPNFPTKVHEIPPNASLVVSGDNANVLSTLPLKLSLAKPPNVVEEYEIKTISSLGTIRTANVACSQSSCAVVAGSGSVSATMMIEGSNGINTADINAILFVSNNSDETITSLQPTAGFSDPKCDDLWFPADTIGATETLFAEDILNCIVTPSLPVELGPHETTLFRWTGTLSGDVGSKFTFCSTVSGSDSGGPITSPPLSCDTLTVIDPNDCGGCGPGGDTFILIDDLLIRPSLFMIIPSPFGLDSNSDPGKALWGVNVVNPTEKSMDVGKITIVSYPPGANANHLVIDPGSCDVDPIVPTTNWSCPGENTLMWESILAPITIPPYSSQSFLAKIDPGSIVGSVDLDALIVQANAFTTTGSFGKSSYQTTMYDIPESLVNIFLTDADLAASEDPTDNAHIFSQRQNIQHLEPEEFKITLADMDEDNDTFIKTGAKMIINVPRDWTDVIITDDTNFIPDGDSGPDDDRVTPFGDGSTQIIVETAVDVGGNLAGTNLQDHITVTFEATPPDNEGDPKLPYLMYVLAYGETGICIPDNPNPCIPTPHPIGPLSEIFLQVVDSGGS